MTLSVSAAGAVAASTIATQGKPSENGVFEHLLTLLQASSSSGSGALGSGADSAGQPPAGSVMSDPTVQSFMKYMNETPAQRFEDSWLAAHGLTEADLKAMSPEKREQIMKEIEQEMKARIEQKTQASLTGEPVAS